jgi:hypothetical protein
MPRLISKMCRDSVSNGLLSILTLTHMKIGNVHKHHILPVAVRHTHTYKHTSTCLPIARLGDVCTDPLPDSLCWLGDFQSSEIRAGDMSTIQRAGLHAFTRTHAHTCTHMHTHAHTCTPTALPTQALPTGTKERLVYNPSTTIWFESEYICI